MYEDQIISQMNDYLHKAAKALASWLGNMLPRSGDNWWDECVISNLSYMDSCRATVQTLIRDELYMNESTG